MNEITTDMIKELRERTGVGMGKCKEALVLAEGDMEKAIDILRKAGMAAGVKKEGLDITISRREVVIEGSREDRTPGNTEDYIYQELYWGSFSRAIELPEEVEPEEAQAHELHGLLTIILPKIDRNKQTKVRVQ